MPLNKETKQIIKEKRICNIPEISTPPIYIYIYIYIYSRNFIHH